MQANADKGKWLGFALLFLGLLALFSDTETTSWGLHARSLLWWEDKSQKLAEVAWLLYSQPSKLILFSEEISNSKEFAAR